MYGLKYPDGKHPDAEIRHKEIIGEKNHTKKAGAYGEGKKKALKQLFSACFNPPHFRGNAVFRAVKTVAEPEQCKPYNGIKDSPDPYKVCHLLREKPGQRTLL